MKGRTKWITPIVCAILLGGVIFRDRFSSAGASTSSPASGPEDAVYSMLDAARTGDVEAWLGSYSGQLAATLSTSVNERGRAEYASYLKTSNRDVKGVAVSQGEAASDGSVRVRVEYVFPERNESQNLYLRQNAGSWKIERLDNTARVPTVIPYGTPVGAR